MGIPPLAALLRPYLWLELPGWGRVAGLAGIYHDEQWRGAPPRVCRGKLHRLRMRLDLTDWSDRQAYFLGRYYELAMQRLMLAALAPGDTFVDVGANVGHLTLLGAAAVGPTGRVIAFEPNPRPFARMRENLALNSIPWATPMDIGLGEVDGDMTLRVVEHTGLGTLRPVEGVWPRIDEAHTVRIRRGDEVAPRDDSRPMLIKIDVEGFEFSVLRGLERTLERPEVAVVTEVVDDWLKAAGTSAAALFEFMQRRGFEAFSVGTRRMGIRHTLNLRPLRTAADPREEDVLWVRARGAVRSRLGAFIRAQ